MVRLLYRFICGFVLLGSMASSPQARVVDLPALTTDFPAVQRSFTDVLEDPLGQWRLQDVLPGGVAAERFTTSSGDLASFGFTRSAYWFRFSVINRAVQARDVILVLPTNWLDDIQIYLPEPSGMSGLPAPRAGEALFQRVELGDTRPFAQRLYPSPDFRLPLRIEPGTHTYYLRVSSVQAFATPIELWQPAAREQQERLTAAYFGMFYGVLLVMVLYNAFVCGATRDSSYAFYCLYLLSFMVMNLGYNGFAFQYLWPDSPRWSNWSHTPWIFLYQIVALLFAMRFLESRQRMPSIHGLLRVVLGLTLLIWLVVTLIGDPLFYNAAPVYAMYMNTPIILVAGMVAWRNGYRAARFFVLASMASLAGCLCTALTVTGFVTYGFSTFHSAEFGILADVVLLSLALADRISLLREQREAAERAMRLEQAQSASLLAEVNVRLEHTVDRRTAELARLCREAEHLARTDGLTGIPNRRAFEEHARDAVTHAVQQHEPLSMVLFDIDRFKRINDRWGHPVGDAVIRAMAQTALHTLRGPDFLARIGGEEFALLLPGASIDQARITAERLREQVASTTVVTAEGQRLQVSASFGVSQLAPDETEYGPLLRRADKAMYLSKQSGRNCVARLPGSPPVQAPPQAA